MQVSGIARHVSGTTRKGGGAGEASVASHTDACLGKSVVYGIGRREGSQA
ncbi:MAG: hypothetical protein AB7E59_12535 [Pusillimonas sp.]